MAIQTGLAIVETDDDGVDRALREDVLIGLAQPQKAIPARWFYDRRGSELFEAITRLPEYYPTRVETALLRQFGRDIANLVGAGRVVVEFGSGSSVKTPLLLRHIAAHAYVPIDISGDFLRQSSAALAAKFPALTVLPVEANFMQPVPLPKLLRGHDTLGFFPGSTIGNLVPASAVDLLRSMRETLGAQSKLLIGFDLVKPRAQLIAAYDDAEGVTAAFNLNLLTRINRELRGTIPVERFRHEARWNPEWQRIEMHLVAVANIAFSVAGAHFTMRKGESIHTENSHKYAPDQARLLLHASGWSPVASWTDEAQAFLIMLADATPHRSAP